MDEDIPHLLLKANIVDKAAGAASNAVNATKNVATAALESVSDKVESMRSTLSPALNNALTPLDSIVNYTKARPLTALACALATGAVLTTLVRPSRRPRSY